MRPSFIFPIPAEQLIPHRPPIRIIDRMLAFDGCQGVVESVIPPDSLYVKDDGSIEQAALVELIAQSFAAVKGYSDFQEEKPVDNEKQVNKGFLVGVKGFVFHKTAYSGDRLLVFISKTGETDEFALAEGRITRGEEVLATGNLMVWIPKEI
jgi:3-hydroxyacyl-[acyl-carrier-protein] dehydratase